MRRQGEKRREAKVLLMSMFICLKAFTSQHFHKTWGWGYHNFCPENIHQTMSMSFAALWVSTSFQFEIFPPKELIFITSSVTRHSFLSVHLMMHVWSEMMMIAWGKRCSGKDCPNRQLLWFWESIHASLKHSSVPLQFQCQRDEDRLFRQLTCTCLTIPMSLAFEGCSGGRTSTANASAMIATTRGKLNVKHDW